MLAAPTARTLLSALVAMLLVASTSAQQRTLLQEDPIVTVHHTSDLLSGNKKGSAAASASAVTSNIAGVSVVGPPSPPAPPSPLTIGDLIKSKENEYPIIPGFNGSLTIPGTPGRNEGINVSLPESSIGVSANGSACIPETPTAYRGFPGCACSCPILPGTGSLLAGYSLDGSIGLPGIEYFNEPARRRHLLQLPADGAAAPEDDETDTDTDMDLLAMIDDGNTTATTGSNDTCSAAVPLLLSFEGCNCTCKVPGGLPYPPPPPYDPSQPSPPPPQDNISDPDYASQDQYERSTSWSSYSPSMPGSYGSSPPAPAYGSPPPAGYYSPPPAPTFPPPVPTGPWHWSPKQKDDWRA